MTRTIPWVTLAVALLLVASPFASATVPSLWGFAPTPEWVTPIPPFATPGVAGGENPGGIERRLLERQFDGREPGRGVSWHAREHAFLTRRGVEEHAQLEIDFDPAYQRLALHEVSIRRGARTIDKRATLRADLLRRETRLASLIHDGERTLHLLLDDVRVGDVVRLAYSVAGENPVLAGHRELTVATERRGSSLGRQRTRLLTRSTNPFHVRTRGREVEHLRRVHGDVHEHLVDLVDPPVADEEDDVPPGARTGGRLVFGDLPDWASVVDWARPLYRLDDDPPAELVALAATIRAAHPDDERMRVAAALRWVQEEIRYFGIELGAGSHRPASPRETLARRFGDCKGKSLLLVALLELLDVRAEPALVDTYAEIDADAFPWRLHAFDHVLVHVAGETRSHWLDPTLGDQRGALGELYEPDHGRALVLGAGETTPRDMASPASARRAVIDKRLALPTARDAIATLEIGTTYHDRLARDLRADIERDGLDDLGRRYADYYDGMFPGIEPRGVPEATETGEGTLRVLERYAVPDPWRDDGRLWLLADEIDDRLDAVPDADGRRHPFALAHPVDVVERWHVTLPEPLAIDAADGTVETPWFRLERTHAVDANGTALSVTWRYRSLADRVEVADFGRHAAAVADARELAGVPIEDRSPVPPLSPPWLRALIDAVGEEGEAPREGAERVVARVELGAVVGTLGLAGVVGARRRREHRAHRAAERPTGSDAATGPDR